MSVLATGGVVLGFGFVAALLWIAGSVIAFAFRYQSGVKMLTTALGRQPTQVEVDSYDHTLPSAVVRKR